MAGSKLRAAVVQASRELEGISMRYISILQQ
jgi:hypothetical protein